MVAAHPPSTKWPVKDRQFSKPPAKGRRGSQVTPQPEASRRGPSPEVMSVARARVTKLEAAMAAVGETDPTFTHLQEALKNAKASCQVRPVEDLIASSKEFIERAKKRIVACQAEVSQAQEALAKAQSKLQQEEQGLTDGEARLAVFMPFWFKPFWLKPFLVQGPHCFGVVGQVHLAIRSFASSVKTDRSHGPQGMVCFSHFFRVIQRCAWTTSTIRAVATSSAMGAPMVLPCPAADCLRG